MCVTCVICSVTSSRSSLARSVTSSRPRTDHRTFLLALLSNIFQPITMSNALVLLACTTCAILTHSPPKQIAAKKERAPQGVKPIKSEDEPAEEVESQSFLRKYVRGCAFLSLSSLPTLATDTLSISVLSLCSGTSCCRSCSSVSLVRTAVRPPLLAVPRLLRLLAAVDDAKRLSAS